MNRVLDLTNLIQGFKFSCQTEGKSPKTIEWYNDFLNKFRKYLNFKGFPIDLKQINRDHVRAYIAYLQNEAKLLGDPRHFHQLRYRARFEL